MNEYKRKFAALVALSMVFSLVGIYTPVAKTYKAEAKYETETSNSCPESGSPQEFGCAACLSCGGNGKTLYQQHQAQGKTYNHYSGSGTIGPFAGQDNGFSTGSGYETKTVSTYIYGGATYTDVTLYYRCHNCGVCEKYSKLVKFTYRYFRGPGDTVGEIREKQCGAERGPGCVPQRWCSKCGPKIEKENGAGTPNHNDFETQATWKQKHIKKVPATKPPTNTPKPPTNTPTPKPTNTPTPVPASPVPATPKPAQGTYEVIYVLSDGNEKSGGSGTFTKGGNLSVSYGSYRSTIQDGGMTYNKDGMAITKERRTPSSFTITSDVNYDCGTASNVYVWVHYTKAQTAAKKYKLSVSADTGGEVNGATSGEYAAGTVISLLAVPDSAGSYAFKQWAGVNSLIKDASGNMPDKTVAKLEFIMPDNDVTLVARFKKVAKPTVIAKVPALTIDTSDGGIASATGDGEYAAGLTVSISCTLADGDYAFAGWECSDSSVTFADKNALSTTLVMPDHAVEIKPTTKKKVPPVTLQSKDGYDRYYSTTAGYSIGGLLYGMEQYSSAIIISCQEARL